MKRSVPWITIGLTVLAGVVSLDSGEPGFLEYSRTVLLRGEIWRIFTCHWTHWSLNHLLWDVLVFAVMGWQLEILSRQRYAGTLLLSVTLIPVTICLFQPEMEFYRGLSGIDMTLCVAFFLHVSRDPAVVPERWKRAAQAVVVLVAVAKIGYETLSGQCFFAAEDGFVPVPLAHAAGLLAGLLTVYLPEMNQWYPGRTGTPGRAAPCPAGNHTVWKSG